jgi:hypothetical protein
MRVRGRFHWRQMMPRSLRRSHLSTASKFALTSASRKYATQPRRMGLRSRTVAARRRPRPWRSTRRRVVFSRCTAAGATRRRAARSPVTL